MLPRRRSNERMRVPVLDATTKRFVFEISAWKIDSSLTDPVRSVAAAMTKARANRRPPRLRRGSLRSQEFCKSQRSTDLPPRSGWRASDATSDEENPTVGRSRKQGRRKPSRERKRVDGYVSRRVLKLDGEEDLFCTPFREERICVLDEEAPHWDVEYPCTPRTPPQAPIRLQQNPFSPTSRRIHLRILSSVSLRLFSAAGWLKKSRRQRHAERKSDGGEVLEDSWHGEEDVAEVSERDEGNFTNVPLLAMQQMRIRADSETFRAQAIGARSDPCVPTGSEKILPYAWRCLLFVTLGIGIVLFCTGFLLRPQSAAAMTFGVLVLSPPRPCMSCTRARKLTQKRPQATVLGGIGVARSALVRDDAK